MNQAMLGANDQDLLALRRTLFGAVLGSLAGVLAWLLWLFAVALSVDFWHTLVGPMIGSVVGVAVYLLERYYHTAHSEATHRTEQAPPGERGRRTFALSAGISTALLILGFYLEQVLHHFVVHALVPCVASAATLLVVGLLLAPWSGGEPGAAGESFGQRALNAVVGGAALGAALSGAVTGLHWLMGYEVRFGGWALLGLTFAAAHQLGRAGRWSGVVGVLASAAAVLATSLPGGEGLYNRWSADLTPERVQEIVAVTSRNQPLADAPSGGPLAWLRRTVSQSVANTLAEPDLPAEMWSKFEPADAPAHGASPAPAGSAPPARKDSGFWERCLGCGDRTDVVLRGRADDFYTFLRRHNFAPAKLSADALRTILLADHGLLVDLRLNHWSAVMNQLASRGRALFDAQVTDADVRGLAQLLEAGPDELFAVVPSSARRLYQRAAPLALAQLRAQENLHDELARREAEFQAELDGRHAHADLERRARPNAWRINRLCLEARRGAESGLVRTFIVLVALGMGLGLAPRLEEALRPLDYPSSRTRRNDLIAAALVAALLVAAVVLVRLSNPASEAAHAPSAGGHAQAEP